MDDRLPIKADAVGQEAQAAAASGRLRNSRFADWSIRKKLLTTMIPAVIVILVVTGFATYRFFTHYITTALERSAILLALAQAHAIEQTLARARDDLLILAAHPIDPHRLREFLETRALRDNRHYVELAYAAINPAEQLLLLNNGGNVVELPPAVAIQIQSSPLFIAHKAGSLQRGQVILSELAELSIPPTIRVGGLNGLSLPVLRLTTPAIDANGAMAGFLVLSLDGHVLRNLLSLYNSDRSPLHGFARTAENRLSFFVDQQGWMLFQSELIDEPHRELALENARAGLSGDHGKPGYALAFRPEPRHSAYWQLVNELQQGRSGMVQREAGFGPPRMAASEEFVAYAPVKFVSDPARPAIVLGGVVFLDRSMLPRAAEFGQLNLMFTIIVAAMLAVAVLLFLVGRIITRPILRLAAEVRQMQHHQALLPIVLPDNDAETTILKTAINDLIRSLHSKESQLRLHDERLRSAKARQPARLSYGGEPASLRYAGHGAIDKIIGNSPAAEALIASILKTAATDADVLIVGETGTGKELTAEAIHQNSSRAAGAYISINCGALDENLLMDALFGHVKGAFSEAKTERKGAFLAADGGTLHLDEIGNASAKVQQSLLRALAVRKIRALGSDQELSFNVRVIAATNVNLADRVQAGEFREDLYYRLRVLSIQTPPLRERRQDIPMLAAYFLNQALPFIGKQDMDLSVGALEKLLHHDWPGNVRELKNCLTRAAAMADQKIILAEGIHLGAEPSPTAAISTQPLALRAEGLAAASGLEEAVPADLNPRQRRALLMLREKELFSRQDYQAAVGASVPIRTAQHDLHDLVRRGLLSKVGRGPATRFHCTFITQ